MIMGRKNNSTGQRAGFRKTNTLNWLYLKRKKKERKKALGVPLKWFLCI